MARKTLDTQAAMRLGSKGGLARSASLTPERRSEIARAGAAVTNAKRAAAKAAKQAASDKSTQRA